MSDIAIEIKELKKQFEQFQAVDNLNLTVERGEMFGVVGPDGAGKTTTLRILCGILKKSSGSVNILGWDIDKNLSEIKKQIGYLSQKFSLYGDLSIDENIEFFAEIHEVRKYKKRREELLEFTRLTQFRSRYADKLSGGMKQKLALACTLIHTPKIIFLDEPTTGVDPVSRRDFWKILSNLRKDGLTIVMTTPYLDEAERCSRVGLMNKGTLMVVDMPQKIKGLMNGIVVEIVCSHIRKAFSILKQSSEINEVQAFGDRLNVVIHNEETDLPLIQAKLKGEGIEIEDWRIIPASLENVFISLIKTGN